MNNDSTFFICFGIFIFIVGFGLLLPSSNNKEKREILRKKVHLNTLQAYDKLVESGVPKEQAEVHVRILEDALKDLYVEILEKK